MPPKSSNDRERRRRINLYKTARWQRMRARQLKLHPMCQCPYCKERGLEADTVDHIEPHRGDTRLMFDARNLQSMHHDCHNSYKKRHENRFATGCDSKGRPLDPEHQWYEPRET